ncbi:MAG: acetyl-CoA carboxylase, carboxyltransferase subunit beta [Dongiaceae bacterium]
MSWLTRVVRPKIRALVGQKDIPDNLWKKCPVCGQLIFHRDLETNLHVCPHCQHHLRLTVDQRLALLFDNGKWESLPLPAVAADPLKFKDRKRYADRLKEAREQTKKQDAIQAGYGRINGIPAVIAAFDFSFMGGSMGTAVGEGLLVAAEAALQHRCPLIAIPASGGARMQEGILSLMQMPRSIIASEKLKQARLPYLVILTDPTTGGVSASFAMVGDITLAEPGSVIGFAGARVIEETIRQKLPEGFQRAEYLRDHGMVDIVVPRKELKTRLSSLLAMLLNLKGSPALAKV